VFSSIFYNRNFKLLWFGHLISSAGDVIFMIALPWLMLNVTGSKGLTALVSMSAYLPVLMFGFIAGNTADNYNRKFIMLTADLIRFFVILIIPISLMYNFISPILIGAVTFFLSSVSSFFNPARDSLIPEITTIDELPIANSSISVSSQMAHLIGPLFAGLGIALFGIIHLFTLDAISFFLSFIFIKFMRIPLTKRKSNNITFNWDQISLMKRYLNKNSNLKTLFIMTSTNNIFIMGPAIIGIPVFVKEVLRSDFLTLAKLESSMALGMIFGSVLFIYLLKRFSPVYILLFGIVADGLTYALLYFIQTPMLALLLLFIHGIAIPLITISRTTIIQKIVPDSKRGRVFAMSYMAVMGTTALSIGLVGFALEYVSTHLLFLFIGFGASLTMIIGCNHKFLHMKV